MAQSARTRSAQATKGYQILSLTDLSAGLDLRSTPTLMGPNRARRLTNFSLEEPGALVVRPGFLAFSTSALGSGAAQGGERVYLNTAIPAVNSSAFTLLAWNGGIYVQRDNGAWASTTPHLTGLSTSAQVCFPYDRDLVAVFDSTSAPKKSTNGTSWTLMGIRPGTVAGTLSSVSTGGLSSAEFEFSWTYKDRDLAHESNGSTALSTLTLTDTGSAQYVIPNSTDAQVDAIVIYGRNKTAGETIRRKVSSGGQSTGTHSTFTITSSGWTSNDEEPSDHDLPPVLSFGVVWKNRWWARSAARTNRLHFTQIFQPQSWPSLFFIDIPFPKGDGIQALVPLGDALMVFGATSIFVIIGQTSLDFEVRPTLDSQDGALGFRATAVIESGVVHAGSAGIYIFDGTTDRLLSHDLDVAWRDLIKNASPADLARVAVAFHKPRKELRVAVPRKYPSTTAGEWVMDLNRSRAQDTPSWTDTDRTIGGYIPWDGPETVAGNRGRLLSWHSTSARLFEESVGVTANSSNMVAEYEGPGLTLGYRKGRWVDMRGEYEPHGGNFTVEVLVDDLSHMSRNLNIAAGLAKYDEAAYGSAVYATAGRRQFYTPFPLSAEGRTFVLRAIYSGQEAFKWFNYHAGIVPETFPRAFNE